MLNTFSCYHGLRFHILPRTSTIEIQITGFNLSSDTTMENMWIILPFMLSFSVLSVHTHAISEEEALARAIRILEQYPLVDG